MSTEIIFKEESDLNDHSSDAIYDIADYCRTCLRHECSLTPTNSSDSDSIKFCDKLAACVSGMRWTKERVTSFICEICIEKLRIAYDFQIVCLQSDRALQLQGEASQIQSSKSETPDFTIATDLAGCDETIEKVILTVKSEETQVQSFSQCDLVTSAAAQLEVNPRTRDPHIWESELPEHIGRHADKKRFQIQTEKKRYACNFCEKSYIHPSKLRVHIHSHTRERRFVCSYCDKKFTRKSLLNAHLKTHTGDKCWRCKICNKSFTRSGSLSVHMKNHVGEKFSCTLCGQKFTIYNQLKVHRRQHTGKQPYKCTICDKVYNYAGQLETHMVTHTGEKLTCSICNKTFARRSHLNSHLKTHTGSKPWQCKICNKSYTIPRSLKEHMMKHTGEKCSCKLCGKEFAHSSGLNLHMRRHTGDKLWQCEICEKSYTLSSQLTDHMKKHTGEKTSCKLCGKRFTWSSTLGAHMKRHTCDNVKSFTL